MKKKFLAILICICTLLPLFNFFSFGQGVELNFERYFSGDTSDWEIMDGNTNLVISLSGSHVNNVAEALETNAYTWYLKTNGEQYQVNPGSYAKVNNGQQLILRFPTFANGFCPSVNPIGQTGEDAGIYYDIDIVAVDKDGNTVYYGKVEDLHSEITDPEIPGVGILNGSRLDSGFRNTDSATELLFTIKENNMQQFYTDRDKYTWRFTAADGENFYSFEAKPTSCNAGKQLLTFEPCLAEPAFIPQKDVTYFINLELWQDGELKYFAGSTIYGYTLNKIPMVPSKKYDITFRVGNQTQTKSYYEGQIPKCDLPTKVPPTASVEYVFTGWQPTIGKVTGPATYIAQFEKTARKYNITFVTDKETVTSQVAYGEIPVYEGDLAPSKLNDGKVKLFTGWDKKIEKVTGKATYTALYRETELSEVPVLQIEGGHFYRDAEKELIVTMTGGKNITAFSFDLLYDQTRFEILEMTPLVDGVKVSGNTVSFEGTFAPANSRLLKVNVKAKADGAFGTSEFGFGQMTVRSKETALGCIQEKAALTLGEVLSGDLNLDCSVNASDADSLITALLKKEAPSKDLYDTNHDGIINLKDAVRICAFVSGKTDDIWSVYDEREFTVTYRAQIGGEIVGDVSQTVTRKQSTESVLALSYAKGFVFDGWSDGRNSYKRQDYGIEENTVLTANFVQQPIILDLPDVRINTLGEEEVNSTTEYRTGMLSITGADQDEYNLTDIALQIKGRGNYSWSSLRDIKPSYRIRLTQKQELLGMGIEEKDWVLLTTYNDVSMLRNYTTWRLGQIFDNVSHSCTGNFVTLYLNGEYKGIYLLCDRIEASRLELEDETMDPDKDYLLELDARASGEGVKDLDWFTVSGGQQPFVIKSQVNSKLETKYIQAAVTMMNNALLSGDRSKIATVVDIPSLVDIYIIEEFGKDRDVGFASFYFYKKAGGKFYFTSPWDFDLAWGNDSAYPKPEGLLSSSGRGNAWFNVLSEQEWFKVMVKARMVELQDKVKALSMEIEATGKALTSAAKQDEAHFGTIGRRLMEEPEEVYTLQSYEEHCAYFVNWYNSRWKWLCEYFGIK